MNKKLVINTETGEQYYEDYSPEELIGRNKIGEAFIKEIEKELKEKEEKDKIKESVKKKFANLGLTANEINVLLNIEDIK